MDRVVIIRKYNRKAPSYFKKERMYLVKALKKYRNKLEIVHFGSTAITGLGGKNIIDIYLISKRKGYINSILRCLEHNTEYFKWRTGGDEERIFMVRKSKIGNEMVTFHLHITWKNTKKYKDALKFCSYIIAHPTEAKRYYALKKQWAKKATTPSSYRKMKSLYISVFLNKIKYRRCY